MRSRLLARTLSLPSGPPLLCRIASSFLPHFDRNRSFGILIRITPRFTHPENELVPSIPRTTEEGSLTPPFPSLAASKPRGRQPPKSADILTHVVSPLSVCHCHTRGRCGRIRERTTTKGRLWMVLKGHFLNKWNPKLFDPLFVESKYCILRRIGRVICCSNMQQEMDRPARPRLRCAAQLLMI